jgi:hypothetical protein
MPTAYESPIHTTVIGVFDNPDRARAAIDGLRVAGFPTEDTRLIGRAPGSDVSVEDGRWFEAELRAGRTVVTVHDADQRAEEAREVLRAHGGAIREPSDIGTYGTGLPATPY